MGRIYVDLDDVLAQTGRMFLRVLAREFGRDVAFEEIRSYHLGESLSLRARELTEFMRLAHQPDALAEIEPMPGAAETMAEWRERGYEIHVVTGRPPTTLEPTLDWLARHHLSHAEFHFLDKYSEVYSGAPGTHAGVLTLADLPRLDFCLAVEDFPGIIVYLANTVHVPVALFDRPWNQELDGSADVDGATGEASIVRCHDWSEIRRRFPTP